MSLADIDRFINHMDDKLERLRRLRWLRESEGKSLTVNQQARLERLRDVVLPGLFHFYYAKEWEERNSG